MLMVSLPIGIFGGTFNPVHHGHLRSALDICEHLQLQEILMMPTFMSPHKMHSHQGHDIEYVSNNAHRLSMLRAATKHCEKLSVSEFELNDAQVSYTVNTIAHFRTKFPNTPLCFLMGMDSFVNFTRWHRWQDILVECHLVVSQRPGYDINENDEINTLLATHQTSDISDLHESLGGSIYFHHAHPLSISSSSIRQLVQTQKSITYLTPPSVENYIIKHALYRP